MVTTMHRRIGQELALDRRWSPQQMSGPVSAHLAPGVVRVMRRLAFAACIILSLPSPDALAQLRGHGGPVRALAIAPDGNTAISGSFDQTAIVWSLPRNAAQQGLRVHHGAVK